jgi:hypothetical protein
VLLTAGLQIVLLSSLKTFVVASNKLTGTVNENIYYLPALAKLDFSNNTLVGTTPPAIGYASGVQAPSNDSCAANITALTTFHVPAFACTGGTWAIVFATLAVTLDVNRCAGAAGLLHACVVSQAWLSW